MSAAISGFRWSNSSSWVFRPKPARSAQRAPVVGPGRSVRFGSQSCSTASAISSSTRWSANANDIRTESPVSPGCLEPISMIA